MTSRIVTAIAALMLAPDAGAICTADDFRGRYVAMIASERSGFWERCNVRVSAEGLGTGSCLVATGEHEPVDPIRFFVHTNCAVSGTSASGVYRYSLKIQPHKRGLIGRFSADDGTSLFAGPVVAVRRGK